MLYPDRLVFWQVMKSLIECTKDIVGSKIENNKFCVSVHYRNVDEKVRASVLIYDKFSATLIIVLPFSSTYYMLCSYFFFLFNLIYRVGIWWGDELMMFSRAFHVCG